MRRLSKEGLRAVALVVVPAAVAALSALAGFDAWQCATLATVALMLVGIALYWEYKIPFAFLGLTLLFLMGSIDARGFVEYSHLDIIVFLACMMIIVEYLERAALFEHLVAALARWVCRGAYSLVALFTFLTAAFSSLVGVVTAALFMVPMAMEVALKYSVDPTPLVMLVVFAANIGSSATAVGNPVGILLAFEADLSFTDFVRWATPAAVVSLVACLLMATWVFREELEELNRAIVESPEKLMGAAGVESSELLKAWALFVAVMAGIALHGVLEDLLGIDRSSALLAVAMTGATVVLFLRRREVGEILSEGVEWGVLLFFLFLFASVEALERIGLVEKVAGAVVAFSHGDPILLMFAVSAVAAALSAVLDNVLTVAFLIPVVRGLEVYGVNVQPLWWALLFAGTYAGNATLIASTANMVAASLMEARKAGRVDFFRWMKYGVPFTALPLLLATLLLAAQYH